MSHDTPIPQTELLASSRVEGCEKTNVDTHYIPESEPNTFVTYLILIITTCTAEETEALESWLMYSNAHGCEKWKLGIHANLVPGITKAYVFLSHHREIGGEHEGFARFWDSE